MDTERIKCALGFGRTPTEHVEVNFSCKYHKPNESAQLRKEKFDREMKEIEDMTFESTRQENKFHPNSHTTFYAICPRK